MSNVDHPAHYGGKDNPYEVIKVIEAWGFDKDFCLGNALKYLGRAGKKSDLIEDLEKTAWYLARKIANLKAERAATPKPPPGVIFTVDHPLPASQDNA